MLRHRANTSKNLGAAIPRVFVHMCVFMYVHIHVYMYSHARLHSCIDVCMHALAHACMHARTHVHGACTHARASSGSKCELRCKQAATTVPANGAW